MPDGVSITKVEAADALNAQVLSEDPKFKPPYVPKTDAVTFNTTEPTPWVRVYAQGFKSGQVDTWMMPAADIKGLSAEQIASKYSLPQVPTHITDVVVPPGIEMRATVANDIKIFADTSVAGNGGGGGVQFEVLIPRSKLPSDWFTNPRPLK